jgi:thiamine biosynthesis lipoprotein
MVTTRPAARKLLRRREVLRILAVGGAAGVAWKAGVFATARPVARSRVLMGTGVHLQVLGRDREAAAHAADAALDGMTRLEALLSSYRDDSELSRLNAAGRIERASPALLDILQLAERISALGDGAFDVTVEPLLDLYRAHLRATGELPPPDAIEQTLARVDRRAVLIQGNGVVLARPDVEITLDGIGKGYVVDRGVALLREHGFGNVFVEAGGDLVAAGDKGSGRPWRIGIRRPRGGLALQARFDARNRAVATSGDYMQPFTPDYAQHHILDPRTGRSAPELASATVAAPDAVTADGLATLCMVLGSRRARELLEDLPGCEGYFVSKELEVTRTSGFATT